MLHQRPSWTFADAYRTLAAHQKPGGGVPIYTRVLNRRLGRIAAAAGAVLGLSPDIVSLVGAATWVAALVVLATIRTSVAVVLLAVLLLLLSFALDSADGQLARLTGRSSLAGEWLDHVVDAVRQVALHLAIAVALFRFAHLDPWAMLVPLGFCVVASTRFVAQILAEQLRATTGGEPMARGGSRRGSLIQLPADTGVLYLSLALLAWPTAFVTAYAALAVANTALLAATMVRRRRELLALDATRVPAPPPPVRWPAVTVVIATVDRPELLRRAVRSVCAQDYDGDVEVLVVHDRTAPRDVGVATDRADRTLRVIANHRTPGLAGARNTGILASDRELVAFCDDDDAWEPAKLRAQVLLWRAHPEAAAIATGISLHTAQGRREHLPPERTDVAALLRSRVLGLHPSSFLIRRADLTGAIGLVDEQLPHSYGEDYDLLLRLADAGDVYAVRRPLVHVDWARTSHFDGHWDAVSDSMTYLLAKFPQFGCSRRGWARIAGQIAFAHAARGRRRLAVRWAARAVSRDPIQLRAYAAGAVALRLISAEWLLDQVRRRGRGL